MSELRSLDRAFQNTRVWLNEVAEELQWVNERRVYTALRTVLHAIRDRLTLPEAVQFGAQLPVFIRGFTTKDGGQGQGLCEIAARKRFLKKFAKRSSSTECLESIPNPQLKRCFGS